MLAVEGIAVGIAERNHFLLLAIETEPVNLVDGFVAHVEKARLIPHRALGKTEARAYYAELGIVIHQIPEMWRLGLQLKLPEAGLGRVRSRMRTPQSAQGCDDEKCRTFMLRFMRSRSLPEQNPELTLADRSLFVWRLFLRRSPTGWCWGRRHSSRS